MSILPDTPQRWLRHGLVVTTDRAAIDVEEAHALLRTAYWATNISLDLLARAMRGSVTFAAYDGPRLVGFARVVTDLATYGYVTDVIVAEAVRGRGIGKLLMECILDHPELQGFRRLTLLTTDAQGLYQRFGFVVGPVKSVYMERISPGLPGPPSE